MIDFVLEELTGLTLKRTGAGLLGAEKDLVKLGLLAVMVLELSLESVR